MHYSPEDGKWQIGKDATLISELSNFRTVEADDSSG